ncbi:DUF4165 domain-containing protein (plasmid) [Pseudomonas sp. FeN3W]|nr:DUF4165 domain-containing protein [Pseudomonas sp. FeN3W]
MISFRKDRLPPARRLSLLMLGSLALGVLSSDYAFADLVKYNYTTTTGVKNDALPTTAFINPSSEISFMVSGGIDRKLAIAITKIGESVPVFRKESSKLLGASDVITFNGNSYYAEEFVSPKLADGRYTVRTEIRSSTGALVQHDENQLVIDTIAPLAGSFSPRPYTWGNPVLTGNVWKLGVAALDSPTYSSFTLNGFSDTSGIKSVTAKVYRSSGELYKAHNVLFSEVDRNASIQYRTGFFPDSDLDEAFDVEFSVTDKAGNSTSTARQKVMFDNIGNAPSEPFGVYDPSVTTELAPGLRGFVPYVPGSYVKTNPIRLAWRIPRSNWHDFRLGGLRFVNSFGENTVVGTDASYVYLVGSLPYRAEDVNYIRFYNFGEWGSQGTIKYDLKLDPSAPRTPVISKIEYYFSDKGWMNYSGRVVAPQELPVRISKVRYTVEPRPFNQIATHLGSCTIPAGLTQCEISAIRDLAKGTSGYLHDQGVLKSADGALSASGQWADVWWNNQYLPIISHTYDPSAMLLHLKIRQPQQGAFQNMLGHNTAWLEDSSGKQLSVSKKLTAASGENFEYEFDLKTLPEGSYSLIAAASEKLGAVSKVALFNFQSDRTNPVVTVRRGQSDSIDTLDKLSFTVSDNKDPSPVITSVTLTGGPAKESIALSYRKISSTTYGLEYPILFPSLAAGESYVLSVTAQDAQKNVGVGSVSFRYTPSMAGIIGHPAGIVSIPAVSSEFNRNDGSRVINSEQLRLADGTPVSGIYDVMATLRSDAVSPLKVAGINVNPGQTVMLGQLNFTSTNGKIAVPVIPLNRGAEGSNGLIISTSAPNSPVVYANVVTWLPGITMEIGDENPVQAMTLAKAEVKPAINNFCQLTTSVSIARQADPIMSPVCLFEWTQIPRGLVAQAMTQGYDHPMTRLTGRPLDAGKQKIGYSISIYNMGSDKVLLDSGEHEIDVQPAEGSASFKHSLMGTSALRAVEAQHITMEQLTGPACSITGDQAVAMTTDSTPICLIEFTELPVDLREKSKEPLVLEGVFKKTGKHSIQWVASIFDTAGKKLILEHGSSYIDVIHPPAETALVFNVDESSSAHIAPSESHPEAWGVKTYSARYQPSYGSVESTRDGFVYTPAVGYVGEDTFGFRVSDESGMFADGVAHVTVDKFNYAPTFTGVIIHTNEGMVSDPAPAVVNDLNKWDSHRITIKNQPRHGVLEVVDDKFVYTPEAEYYGEDNFSYVATDEAGLSIEGKGVVIVSRYNRAPTSILPGEIVMQAGRGGSTTLRVLDPNRDDSHQLHLIKQPAHGMISIDGMRLVYRTRGNQNTAVTIRAVDQDGMFVDRSLRITFATEPQSDNVIRLTAPVLRAK